MILTTNRITSLDIAVQSRIHLAIRYEDLKQKQKINIFKTFLKQLKPECLDSFDDIMDYVETYGSETDPNGRQIRNIVSSALSLARNSKTGDDRMTKKHLKDVLDITKDFQKQLEKTTLETRASNEAGRSRR